MTSSVSNLLADLIRIESINPQLAPGVGGESAAAEHVAKFCARHGIEYELQPVLEGRPNVLAWTRGTEETRIAFVAHLDTVPVANWKRDPFGAERDGGRIYGRGACDTKASLAAMLTALGNIRRDKPRATIFVVGAIDEEYRKAGARALAQAGMGFEAAVIGEPTELELIGAHKGSVRWRAETAGRAAHSSTPERGVNAITGMAHVVSAIDKLGKQLRSRSHPLVGSPALTMSLIQGGSDLCTVPAHCEISIDRRLVPGESATGAVDEVEDVLARLRAEHEDLSVRSILPAVEDSPVENATGSHIAKTAAEACQAVAGTGSLRGAPYGTDASQLAPTGIKCIVLGPGSVEQAHTNEEFVDLDQVEKASDIYRRIMLTY